MIGRIILFLSVIFLQPVCQAGASSPQERLAQVIRFQTVSHQEKQAIDYSQFVLMQAYLRRSYPRVFGELDVEVVSDHSLLIVWPGEDQKRDGVLFTAHTDVVPIEPGTAGDWQHSPFMGVIADGRIYGRGTLDDKQGVMGLLEATEKLLADGYTPARNIVLAFGHDEEISGREGAAKLAKRMRERGLHFEWMVDEGGMLLSDNPLLQNINMAMINVAEKGYLTLTLSTSGEGGHSSNPPAVSTIGRLSAALVKIEANPFPATLVAPVEAMFTAVAPHVGQPQRFIFNNLWLTGGFIASTMDKDRFTRSLVRTTTALTMFHSGIKENVVPQRAEAKVNFRLLPGATPEQIVAHIENAIDDPAIEISFDNWENTPPVADFEAGGFELIGEAVKAAYPDAVIAPSLLPATTDTRHYIDLADNHYRFHGVLMTSSQTGSIHGTDEFIEIDSYLKSIEVAEGMLRLAGQ